MQTTGPDRLIVGPSDGHINLMIGLTRLLAEPFGILYVLRVPRRSGRQSGRYQCHEPKSRRDCEGFLKTYAAFFEGDGRHHLWVQSLPDEALLVYDHHNVLFAYGLLDSFEDELSRRGFRRGTVCYPAPHTHHYHSELDEDEDAVLSYWKWRYSPLQEMDDP